MSNLSPVCYHCTNSLGGAVFVLWNILILHVKVFAARVLEENLFLNLADAIEVFDFHFNLEFVLFGVFR